MKNKEFEMCKGIDAYSITVKEMRYLSMRFNRLKNELKQLESPVMELETEGNKAVFKAVRKIFDDQMAEIILWGPDDGVSTTNQYANMRVILELLSIAQAVASDIKMTDLNLRITFKSFVNDEIDFLRWLINHCLLRDINPYARLR